MQPLFLSLSLPRRTAHPTKRPTVTCTHPLLSSPPTQRHFLTNHWQKRPLLLPQLLPNPPPLSPSDLVQLALDTPYSRIIQGNPDLSSTPPFSLSLGPFAQHTFDNLPNNHWTLLVDHVNRYYPPLNELLDAFSFIPNWRFDDVMVSYAPPGGSVGPHVDNYDVFLVQAAGKRLWKTSTVPISHDNEEIIPDIDVRVLQHPFQSDMEHILHPGDALYIPPRFPHHGISLDEHCITYSIGFRAPTISQLLTAWVDHVIEKEHLHEKFYEDPLPSLLSGLSDPARIDPQAADHALSLLNRYLPANGAAFRQWFAREMSVQKAFVDLEPRAVDLSVSEAQPLHHLRDPNATVRHREGSVFTYMQRDDGAVALYVDGASYPARDVEAAAFLCAKRVRKAGEYVEFVESGGKEVVEALLRDQVLYVDNEEEEEEGEVTEVTLEEEPLERSPT